MKEQGFENEFDEIDTISHHIVAFNEEKPIGTCRFFKENNHYTIGRVAVLKEYRNQHIGNLLIRTAEKEIKKLNGDLIVVHAQVRICPFYEQIATRIPKFTLTVKMLFSINASWNLSRVSLSIDKVTKNPSL